MRSVSTWCSCRFFSVLSVVLNLFSAISAGFTRVGGPRQCPIRSSALREGGSSEKANVLICAVKTRRFHECCVATHHETRATAGHGNKSLQSKCERAPVTRKTFHHELANCIFLFFNTTSAVTTRKKWSQSILSACQFCNLQVTPSV